MMTKTKTKKRKATYVELEHEHGIAKLHCPVCGKNIVNEDDGLREKLCRHVLLVEDWIGEFTTRDEEIEKLVEAAVEEADEKDVSVMDLMRKNFGPNVVFFESFEPGRGPKDPSTFTVAIDMGMAGRTAEG
jgi:hypothetical protein